MAAAELLHEQYDFAHLMVTRSEKGITVIGKDGKVWNNPATAREVFDVSGAGDTVAAASIAYITAAIQSELSMISLISTLGRDIMEVVY